MDATNKAPKVGVREVAIVLTPLLSLVLTLVALYLSLPPIEAAQRADLLKAVTPPHSLADMNLLRVVMAQYAEGSQAKVGGSVVQVE